MIGDKIRELRVSRGFTQEQLSKQMDININTLASYERNFREPKIDTIIEFCKFFKVSTDFLLGVSSYQNNEHNQAIDALFEKLSLDTKVKCTNLQMSIMNLAGIYQYSGTEYNALGEIFDIFVTSLDQCISAYQHLVEDNDVECNFASDPSFFLNHFTYTIAQMLESIPKVADCVYHRWNTLSKIILIDPSKRDGALNGEHQKD